MRERIMIEVLDGAADNLAGASGTRATEDHTVVVTFPYWKLVPKSVPGRDRTRGVPD